MNDIATYCSATYTWAQFTPAFILIGVAAVLLMADTFIKALPKRAYAVTAALSALLVGCYTVSGEHTNAYSFLACLATGLSILVAYDYTKVSCASIAGGTSDEGTGEFYALPLVACAGILCLTQAADLIMVFVSLEVVTLTSYVLAGYFRRNQGSIEAGIKYLVLGAMSTGILVFGAAWYFGMTGTFILDSDVVIKTLSGSVASGTVAIGFLMSVALLFLGAFFKVGAAPMHVWIPDVYQGAPTPTTTFLAVASKTAGFALLCALVVPFRSKLLAIPGTHVADMLVNVFAVVAGATLLIGNLGALFQSNAKRLLGYSSIGQAGFILVFFLNLNPPDYLKISEHLSGPVEVLTYKYLLAYTLATVAAFFAIAMVRTQRGSEEISAFRGLGKTNPRTAFLIVVSFASLAGVPLTMGFMVKMASFFALVGAMQSWTYLVWLLPIMILTATAGFYYYFKIIRTMYWEKPQSGDKPLCVPFCTACVMTACAIALIVLGTWPLLTTF